MSYSRWGGKGSGYWYTFWCTPDLGIIENNDNVIFEICAVTRFTAKELREDIDGCMHQVYLIDRNHFGNGDIEELKTYTKEFLADVDKKYKNEN